MKNMTAKETALEYTLMILHSVIPGEEATQLMVQLGDLANGAQATPAAKENFDKANTLYLSLDENKAQRIMIVESGDLAKFCEFRDLLLAVSDNINDKQYLATVADWDQKRDVKTLADGQIAFQLTICESDCSGCNRRKLHAQAALEQSGVKGEITRGSRGYLWANLPALPEGVDLKEYLQDSLDVRITSLNG